MFLKSSMPTRKRVVTLLIQVMLMLTLYLAARAWMQQDMVSGAAPELMGRDIHGEALRLSEITDRPVLIHFWATWCPICEFEQGAITKVDKDWPVITVAMQSGGRADVAKYMEEHQLQWKTVVDETGALSQRYGVTGVPASFVVDANNNVRFKETGLTSSWGLRFRLWLSR